MKAATFLCATLLAAGSQAAWIPQSSPVNQTLNAVWAVNANLAFIAGDSGTILKTTDGGSNWVPKNSGTTAYLNAIYFVNSNLGYAVGGGGTIVMTLDGGDTWSVRTDSSGATLYSVCFPTAGIGYAVGTGGTLLKAGNGGLLWTPQNSGITDDLYSVSFSPSNTNVGYAASHQGKILKTSDQGANWSASQSPNNTGFFTSVSFLSASTGYAGGDSLYYTANGGATWYSYGIGMPFVWSVTAVDGVTAYGVGEFGAIWRTEDAGAHWASESVDSSINLNSVSFVDANTGWAVGGKDILKRTTVVSARPWELRPGSRSASGLAPGEWRWRFRPWAQSPGYDARGRSVFRLVAPGP